MPQPHGGTLTNRVIEGKKKEQLISESAEMTKIEINEEILKSPEIINRDPYSDGWLFKVKVPNLETNKKNLLSGGMVKVWMENTVERLSNIITGNEGMVLQDGGVPVSGFFREIPPDDWEKFANEFLLTSDNKYT